MHVTTQRIASTLLTAALTLGSAHPALAQERQLNLYSSRHYETDEALYANFTRHTGVRINRIEAGEDPLIERIRNEGARSPADVLITVDAGRLWRAEELGFFQPVKSALLDARIPANLRHPQGLWFGFSTRARVIYADKARVAPGAVSRYEDLADPRWKGKVCARSGGHVYNLSLLAGMIARSGEQSAEAWARGVVANFARSPKGGDTDQIAAVASGECELALANTYYYARLARSAKPQDRAIAAKAGLIYPNQAPGDRGTHVNISGAGVLKHAPNRDTAIRFLEYLASDEAQRYFADGNNEWPAVATVKVANPVFAALGEFRQDTQAVAAYGRHQPAAQRIFDRAGWK
ncbi:MAG: Fe(3+) ABC transporter substrate-binding protein [Burkholderiales bacterium]|nr:Fe(3+) ABC transporter substrate-binding protein [Burkholderiales bacterium]